MRKILLIILAPLILLLLISFSNSLNLKNAFAQTAGHVVISEIQIGGSTSNDEFIELYNPTDSEVDLTDWEILRKTALGTEFTLIATLSGNIQSHGYFLIAHSEYDGAVSSDQQYSENPLAANNTVLLKDNLGADVDKVGMGAAVDFEGTDSASSPANNRSIERKAFSQSSSSDMIAGGLHENSGNGEDSDDNSLDFILRPTNSGTDPQNTSSPTENPSESTPTETPTPTDETTPTPTLSPTDDPSPTSTATPTLTSAPTEEPTPTEIVTPTPTPTATPSKVKLLGFFPLSRTVCYLDFSRGFFVFPRISCITL